MLINSPDRTWILSVLAMTAIAAVFYATYAVAAASPPSGGSWPGLTYGIAGTGMIAFAGLLGIRRKFPTMRVGRAQTWMRGHIWLGLLSFPLIVFHAGFALGGTLTTVLMILFTVITLSGILGLILQQFIPRLMMQEIPSEVIYERADEFLSELRQRAARVVESLLPKSPEQEIDDSAYAIVKEFHDKELKPFLDDPSRKGLLATERQADLVFGHVRKLVPPRAETVLDDLHKIVEQRRSVAHQIKLHSMLHGWLLIHVPLSASLLVLILVHAVMALRYT